MAGTLEEITATIVAERFRFGEGDDATVILDGSGQVNGDTGPSRFSLKGKTEGEDLQPHLTYRFYGQWRGYNNRRTGVTEKQFWFKTFVRAAPLSEAGIKTYLSKAPNIGKARAISLWSKFGGDAVRILREQPDVAAAAVRGLTEEKALEAAEYLRQEQSLESATIEVIGLTDGRGFPKGVAKLSVKEWGNLAADVIRANPYLLMRFPRCGFKRTDALYLELGHPPARLKRQALCAWYHIALQSNGDTWHYRKVAEVGLQGAISGSEVQPGKALELATRAGMLAIRRTDGINGPLDWDGDAEWLAEGRKARNETRLADAVRRCMAEQAAWPDIEPLRGELTDHQFERLDVATMAPLSILGGGPGTGKTFTAAKLIKLCVDRFGEDQVAVMAPTGKAAVRISEAMQQYGLPLPAKTIHSTLKVQSGGDDGWSFEYGAGNPLPFRVLVVDESSMIDTDLAASLFAARAPGALVLLVGDVGQLPPVGHGAPLRDLIEAGACYGELSEIRRNSGQIVAACADIRRGGKFETGGNLVEVRANGTSGQVAAMLDTIRKEVADAGCDPVWDCQVLVPVNKKSELSRRALNEILQTHLNPNPKVGNQPFRLGDKVVNLKNGWFPPVPGSEDDLGEDAQTNADGRVYVANGELGKVVLVEQNYLHVALKTPDRLVVVPRGQQQEGEGSDEDEDATGTGCNWDLGYALSCHKAQGSEWPHVIVMVDDSPAAAQVCSREWIYTAISRAKTCCYLVGKLAVAQGFTRRTAIDKRKTFLRELITNG